MKMILIGILVLFTSSMAMAGDWYFNTNVGIVDTPGNDKDVLAIDGKPRLSDRVIMLRLGKEVYESDTVVLSLEGGMNLHPEHQICAIPEVPEGVEVLVPPERVCLKTIVDVFRIGTHVAMPFNQFRVNFGFGWGRYYMKNTLMLPGLGTGSVGFAEQAIDFFTGADYRVNDTFSLGGAITYFQYKDIENATSIGLQAKVRF